MALATTLTLDLMDIPELCSCQHIIEVLPEGKLSFVLEEFEEEYRMFLGSIQGEALQLLRSATTLKV